MMAFLSGFFVIGGCQRRAPAGAPLCGVAGRGASGT